MDRPRRRLKRRVAAALVTAFVNLAKPINVLILYGTALATEAGATLFLEDVYGYDRKLEHQLACAAALSRARPDYIRTGAYQKRTAPLSRCTKSELG
jgi:hypothetical protein